MSELAEARPDRPNRIDENDRALVVAHLAGDPEAFPAITRTFYRALFGHAYRLLHDQRAAEDAVQEALLRAYRALPRFSGNYRLGPWLHQILTHVCLDEGHRRQREAQANERWFARPEATVPVDSVAEQADATQRVADALAKLPANYREVLVLRDMLDMDYADVASRAGISEENARARVARARAAMRRLVGISAGILAPVGGFIRRTGRASADVVHQASPTLATMSPDAVVTPVRAGIVATSMATAALAAAAALPGGHMAAAPVQTPSVTAPADANSTAAGHLFVPATAAAAPLATTSTTLTTSTTSTALGTVVANPAGHSSTTAVTRPVKIPATTTPGPTTTLAASVPWGPGQLTAESLTVGPSSPAAISGPANLTIGQASASGTVSGSADLRGDPNAPLSLMFVGTTADGRSIRIEIAATVTPGTAPMSGRHLYNFAGTTTDHSTPPSAGAQPSATSGTLSVSSDGGANVLYLDFNPPGS